MAFDAGAIIARLDISTDEANRKLDDFEKRADRAARDRHIRLDASFDEASIGKARQIFAQLDNQLSRDAASRLRSSPQGSVLGSLNALFSPHSVSGSTTAQQAVSQGMLGQVAKQTAKSLPGVTGSSTQTETVNQRVNENVRRSFLGGLLGGIFGGGGGGGGDKAIAEAAAAGGAGGSNRGSFLGRLFAGIGPNILGLGTKASLGIAGGGSLLGALPALLGPLAALGVGGLGVGAGAGILKSAISSSGVGSFVSQYQQAQQALQSAVTPQQRQAAQQQLASATAGARAQGGAGFSVFNSLNSLSNTWQNFSAGFLPSAAKILGTVSSLFKSLTPVLQGFFGNAVKLLQPFIRGIGDIARQVLPALGTAFKYVAPLIRPLVDGLGKLVGNVIKGLLPALKDVGPIIKPFGQILGALGKDVGQLFSGLAPAFRQSVVILRALFGLIGSLLPVIAKLAVIFAKALAPAFSAFAKVIKELEPVLTLIGHVLGALAGAILSDLVSAFTAVATLIKDISPALNVLAKTFELLFNVLENSGAFAVLGDALEKIAPLLASLVNAIVIGLAPVLKPLVSLLSAVATIGINLIVTALQAVIPLLVMLIKDLLIPILPLINTLVPFINLLARVLGDILVGAIKLLTPVLRIVIDILGFIVDVIIGSVLKALEWLIKGITDLAGHWTQAWTDIKHWAEDAWQFITHGWGQFLVPGITLIRDAISFLRDHWHQIWSDITGVAKAAWDFLDQQVWQPFAHLFTVDFPSWFKDGINAVKQIWGDIEQIVLAPVNWIIQHPIDGLIHAFDWISSKVGGPNIAPIPALSLSHGGRLAGWGGGDIVPALLEPGEAVVDKHRAKKFAGLLGMMGVPGYKHGGGIFSDIGGFFSDLWHGGGILAALATGNFKAASNDFMKLLGGTGVGGAVGDFASLLTAIPHFLVSQAIHSLISLFTGGGPGGGAGITGNVASYRGLILRVLAMLGQPAADLMTVERQMTTESGGNPDVVNKWDSNWKAGHPSVGLMQVIQGTFDAYAGPFRNVGPFLYGVSTNPLANIFAGLNYALHAYGPGWTSVLGQGHGYDSGGWLKPGWAFNFTKGREAVLTNAQSDAFLTVAEYFRQLKHGGGGGTGVMRDVYLTLPEGATVAKALSDLDFKLRTMTQEVGVMTP